MARRLTLRQEQENLERWLEQRGFQGNPFGIYQAELEERLADYFIPTVYYDEIKGTADAPRTMVVFAARGHGKSAHRIMVARSCRPAALHGDILAAPYIDFGPLPAQMAEDPKSVRLSQHLTLILHSCAKAFVETLIQDPDLVATLGPEWLSRLKWLCVQQPSMPVLTPSMVLTHLRELARDSLNLDWGEFQRAWHAGRLGELLRGQAVLEHPAARFLITLADTRPEAIDIGRLSAARLLNLFTDLVRQIGLKAVYILVDRVDEVPPMADDPAIAADFVEPLLANLPLMECPGAAFRFFLPLEIQSALAEKTTIRYDRLLFRQIVWDESSLIELLRQRLIAFSGGKVEALSDLCDEAEVRRGWRVDQDVVQHAQGSPRNLLRLGELLLWAHARQPEGGLSLTRADWESALSEFYGLPVSVRMRPPLHPPLRLDKKSQVVWVGTQKVKLQDAPFYLLSYLYDRAGRIISNYELMIEVGLSYDNLRQQVRRIRQAIEPNPKHPVYLVSIRGRGLRLDNVVKRS